jgi:hypothetical protein
MGPAVGFSCHNRIERLRLQLQEVSFVPDTFFSPMTACEAAKANLSRLYEHWEEAAELN